MSAESAVPLVCCPPSPCPHHTHPIRPGPANGSRVRPRKSSADEQCQSPNATPPPSPPHGGVSPLPSSTAAAPQPAQCSGDVPPHTSGRTATPPASPGLSVSTKFRRTRSRKEQKEDLSMIKLRVAELKPQEMLEILKDSPPHDKLVAITKEPSLWEFSHSVHFWDSLLEKDFPHVYANLRYFTMRPFYAGLPDWLLYCSLAEGVPVYWGSKPLGRRTVGEGPIMDFIATLPQKCQHARELTIYFRDGQEVRQYHLVYTRSTKLDVCRDIDTMVPFLPYDILVEDKPSKTIREAPPAVLKDDTKASARSPPLVASRARKTRPPPSPSPEKHNPLLISN